MLAEERKAKIISYVNERHAVTAAELMQEFSASEATIRRDLTELDKKGLICKVHGGAVSIPSQSLTDHMVSERVELNLDDKRKIAMYAAGLIQDNDCVYIDAGTTTGLILEYITARNITIITNAILHAYKLTSLGFRVLLTGGFLKPETEALIGPSCFEILEKYNFSIGFFGANGISHNHGITTPDIEEARIKELAIMHTRNAYILADPSKFNVTAPVRFASYSDVSIITTEAIPAIYHRDTNIITLK